MGFFRALIEFLENIFNSSSPEVKKRRELKKIENELREISPVLFKNGKVHPNFAELLRILQESTKTLSALLFKTISNPDKKISAYFRRELIICGFEPEKRQKLDSLSYANRSEKIRQSKYGPETAFVTQRKALEDIVKELNSAEFLKIEKIISDLDCLADLCKFDFAQVLKNFDSSYDGILNDYVPNFVPIAAEVLTTSFQDLYFLTANLSIKSSLANAIFSLAQLKNHQPLLEKEKTEYLSSLKKISTILKKNLTAETLKKFTLLAKREPDATLQTAEYKTDARRQFATFLEEQFRADESRIKSELKDQNILEELQSVFGDRKLSELKGYNEKLNSELRKDCPSSFLWITPMEILKSFVENYMSEKIWTLLNTIVVEGFFNVSTYKTEFSQAVFACSEIAERIHGFEDSFNHEQRNDSALITGFIADSHKDSSFMKDLTLMVDTINAEAKQILQNEAECIFDLALKVQEILADVKKSSPDVISNIKVLMMSARNRDTYEQLDKEFQIWKNFLKVMKNYVIIGDIDKKK